MTCPGSLPEPTLPKPGFVSVSFTTCFIIIECKQFVKLKFGDFLIYRPHSPHFSRFCFFYLTFSFSISFLPFRRSLRSLCKIPGKGRGKFMKKCGDNQKTVRNSHRLFSFFLLNSEGLNPKTGRNYFSQKISISSPFNPLTKASRTGKGSADGITASFGWVSSVAPAARAAA